MANNLPTEIGKPAHRALLAAGYRHLEQLTELSEADLLRLHGVGPKAIDRGAMRAHGLSFANEERG
jgi:hypothetical protein